MRLPTEALGRRALQSGHFQEAVNIFRGLIVNNGGSSAWFNLGHAFAGLEEYQTARWAYYKALDMDVNNRAIQEAVNKIEATILTKSRQKQTQRREVRFRTLKNIFEQLTGNSWKPFFVKGVNLGLGLPGYFPGEYPIGKRTYRQWFDKMSEAGFNAVRVYAIQSPSFYEALYEHNEQKDNLFLLQGIWSEIPHDNNFSGEQYMRKTREHVSEGIRAIFGDLALPERPGLPHGTYTRDVSRYTLAIIFGREWEACAVGAYNSLHKLASNQYNGQFLSITRGTPFESWITMILDFLLQQENSLYGVTHPVSTVCWPTLDPLSHPSESTYEEDLRRQGMKVRLSHCNENEDVESFDAAKIIAKKGNGYFATYHAYPYYPDFMNNDFLNEDRPYRVYLNLLRAHHGQQPILIAEFGVPSSREVAHWNRLGWHHGCHDEKRQGELNGEMMKDIHASGMAGGALFSWFDEWFKRNWLFMNYEIPADRNQLWFNLQDAEQCYGLIAAYPGYPGKAVSLKGDYSEWNDAVTLYRNEGSYEHRFNDSADASRRLQRLLVQHDEAFIYLLIETGDVVDFDHASYVVGIDTCDPAMGEFQLPFNLKVSCPIGLKFIIHLRGLASSRILSSMSYDKYLNDGKADLFPQLSREGAWVVMQNRTNERRISKDGKRFYPAKIFSMSPLRHGSLELSNAHHDSLADFYVSKNIIELRIPWGLIMVSDPSSKKVYWRQGKELTRPTDGVRFVVFSYKPSGKTMAAQQTGKAHNATDMMPRVMLRDTIRPYSWTGWEVPLFHFYEKKSLSIYSRYLSEIGT